jgi:hypothetical protein
VVCRGLPFHGKSRNWQMHQSRFLQLCTFIAFECKKLSLSGELASRSDD